MGARVNLTATPVADSASRESLTSRVLVELSVTTYSGTFNTEGSVTGELSLEGVKIADLGGALLPADTTTLLYRGEHTVQHEADGSKTIALAAWISVTENTANVTAEKEVALPHIYRGAILRFGDFTLGRKGAIAVELMKGHVCTVTYSLGSRSGTVARSVAQGPIFWTPPEELAQEITQSAVGSGRLMVETWEYGVSISRKAYAFSAAVPAHMVPQAALESLTLQSDTVPEDWQVAVAGHTRLAYRAAAQSVSGAQITDCRFTCGGAEGEGTEGVTGILEQSGTFVPRITVTDSRGRTAAAEGEAITVVPYFLPYLAGAAAVRCLSDGTSHEGGSCVRLDGQLKWADIGGRSTAALQVRRREVGGAWSDWAAAQSGDVLAGFDANTAYELQLRTDDTLGGRKTVSLTVPAHTVSLHLRPGGSGGAFGQFAEKDGVLQIAWDVEALGGLTVGGKTIADLIYPVGSIYMSVAAADPAVLFGGTWQRIRDTFLLAAGSTYAAASTGGAAKVKLSESELPRLSGTVNFRAWSTGSPYAGVSGIINNVGEISETANGFAPGSTADGYRQLKIAFGGDGAHNNMPPYLAVYVWQRTA